MTWTGDNESNFEPRTPREKRIWEQAQQSLRKQLHDEAGSEEEPKSLTIQDVRQMTPEQINERWDEVIPVLEEAWR